MRIAVTYDKEQNLKPLDQADLIGVIDEEKKEIEQYENEGLGSKEATMDLILGLDADAIIVKEGFLCPGSYYMSYGRIKYIPSKYSNLKEIQEHFEEIKKSTRDDLEEEMYAENEF
ncbi:hypothetical protein [Sulfuracidifex tepidarius]|uniref:Dinitrogenase iron-molybdenum cofactor biosynthesis domain-containing protein n=1 Tax=Sulfuracidifex tepidarius TaxID=1294262 RepID=A0A510E4S5_9CREN|nr:hypothetical protein [Sulfuracidifex tepidarius]BBG24659.1 hypothetical protein IC006_1992 [Sulfuracidifex tepidarius]BBG27447.1 hypothetical protein IC007_2000 [Sulfuracidifex tepidarius]